MRDKRIPAPTKKAPRALASLPAGAEGATDRGELAAADAADLEASFTHPHSNAPLRAPKESLCKERSGGEPAFAAAVRLFAPCEGIWYRPRCMAKVLVVDD